MKKITLLLILLCSAFGFAQIQTFEGFSPGAVNNQPAFGWKSLNKLYDQSMTPISTGNLIRNWEVVNTPAPVPANLGARSVYMRTEEFGQGNKLENWLFSQQVTVPENAQLTFYTRTLTLGDQGSVFKVYVTNSPDPLTATNFVLLQTWTELSLTTQYNQFQQKTVDIKNAAGNFFPAGTQLYLAFVREVVQPGLSVAGDAWFIDNVDVVQKCLAPTLLSSPSQNCTEVVLNWNHSGTALNFQLEIIESAFAPTGVPTDVGVVGTTFTKTGLLETTAYKYYVRAQCTTDNFSDWAGPFNFITKTCGVTCSDPLIITTVPYTHHSNTVYYGDTIDINQGNACGTDPVGTNFLTGNDVFYKFVADQTGNIDITLTPTSATDTRSSIFVYNSCNIINNSCLAGVANNGWEPRNIPLFPVVQGETYYFLVSSNASTQTVDYTLTIQWVNCLKPANLVISNVPGETTSSITTTGLTIEWTDPTNTPTSQYNIIVQGQNEGVPTVVGQYLTNADGLMTYTINDLNPATKYEIWVRTVCPDGPTDADDPESGFSPWVGPVKFNTLICNDADKCTYIIRTRDSANNGWSGNRMQISQNGILLPVSYNGVPVANGLIGNNTSGSAPQDFTVSICPNVEFSLNWLTGGTNPQQCIVEIINSFGQIVYTKAAGVGSQGSLVYTGIGKCDAPACNIAPTDVAIITGSITTNGATITWDAPSTGSFGWDIYVVNAGSPAPTVNTVPTYSDVIENPFVIPNALNNGFVMLPDHSYDVYVRVVCDTEQGGGSAWSAPQTFTTLPTCPKPTNIGVTANTITTTGATLFWTNGTLTDTTWDIVLVPGNSMTAPTGDPVIDANTLTYYNISPTGSSFTVNNLQPAQIYYYYIRTVCPPDDSSTWTGPFVFNTKRCEDADMCAYKFFPGTINGTGNWGTTRVEIRQNGIPVATLGTPTNTINNANGVTVMLCHGVPYEIVRTVIDNNPATVANIKLTVQNPFLDVIHSDLIIDPTINTPVMANGVVNCIPAPCSKPTDMTVTNVTATTAQVQWTDNSVPASAAFDLYVVTTGSPAPTNDPATVPTHPGVINGYVITDLTPSTSYQYYVRAVCGEGATSTWTILTPITFITTPVNDLCVNATPVTINADQTCLPENLATGNTYGGTNTAITSTNPLNGTGCLANNLDVWYSFVATHTSHTITISDIVKNPTTANFNINHSLFGGTCDNMTLLYCSTQLISSANELVVGNTYYIRVYKTNNTNNDSATFKLCVISPPLNDECVNSTTITTNTTNSCSTANTVSGNTFAASNTAITLVDGSLPLTGNICAPSNIDVWYDFIATSTKHTIVLSNIESTPGNINVNLNYALFSGTCDNMNLIFCSATNITPTADLVIGQKYYIRVYKTSNVATQSATFNLCIISPPVNDECSTATPVTVNPEQFCLTANTITGNTFGSTASNPVLNPPLAGTGCGPTFRDVWYSFVATHPSHMINFSNIVVTPSSATNTKLNYSVFSGTCDELTKINCYTNEISQVNNLTPGETYYIRVYTSVNNNDHSIKFDLCITSPPANDDCQNSIGVTPNSGQICSPVNSVSGSTLGASPSNPVLNPPLSGTGCGANRNDIWYHFIATEESHAIQLTNIVVTPQSAASSLKLEYSVFSGPCDNLVKLYCSTNNYLNVLNLVPGEKYYIRVYTNNTNVSQYASFKLCITSPPVNDDCAQALPININQTFSCNSKVYGSTIGATQSSPTVTSANCSGTTNDVWYKFTADANGTYFINADIISGSSNTVGLNHALYTGTCDNLTVVYCTNQSNSTALNLVPNQDYWIRVYTSGSSLSDFATFTLCIKVPPPPAINEDCITATPVGVNAGGQCLITAQGNLIQAAPSAVPIGTCLGTADDDVWFSFVATANQHFIEILNVEGTTTNLNHAVYRGTCANLVLMHCSTVNNLNSTNTAFVPGQTYYVRIWSNSAAAQIVAFELCIKSISTCETAEPFCSSSVNPLTFPNSTNVSNMGQIGCLFSTPNPTFYYLRVESDGYLEFSIRQSIDINDFPTAGGPGRDVDFIAWGPFHSPQACDEIVFGPCPAGTPCRNNTTNPGDYPAPGTNIVDCSYDSAVTETLRIPNAQAGQYYLLLLTNYANQPGFIRMYQSNSGNNNSGETSNLCCEVDLGDNIVTCQKPYNLDAAVNDLSAPGEFVWYFNNAIIEGATTRYYEATETGIYRVVGTCGLNTDESEVYIEFLPEIESVDSFEMHICEGAQPNFGSFDLSSITPASLELPVAGYMISIHISLNDAEQSINPVDVTELFFTQTVTVYIRIQSDSVLDCVKIIPLELVVDKLSVSDFEYIKNQFCTNEEENPIPTFINDGVAGLFTATPSGLIINATTGEINLANSEEGIYIVTNSLESTNACLSTPTSFEITITKQRVADFHYSSAEFCNNGTASIIFDNNGEIGELTVEPAVGLSLNVTTGAINLASSTIGTYIVKNTIAQNGACEEDVHLFEITITEQLSASISYNTPFCASDLDIKEVTIQGSTNGEFSSTPGLSINATTGAIDPQNSTPGTYSVKYHVPEQGSCAEVNAFTTVVIAEGPKYDFVHGCEGGAYVLTVMPKDNSFDPLTSTFTWSGPSWTPVTGSNNSIVLKASGSYNVIIKSADGCETVSENIDLSSIGCQIQRGISPDGNGENDNFDLSLYNVKDLKIYNRYGTEIYSFGQGYTNQWHGQSSGGKELPNGTYFYVFTTLEGQTISDWIYINRTK